MESLHGAFAAEIHRLGGVIDSHHTVAHGVTGGWLESPWARLKAKPVRSPSEQLQRRAVSRFMSGACFDSLLLVTLTTPETFRGDLHDAWRKFLWRCRRRGLFRRYFAVREFNERGTCEHLHVVFQTRTEVDAVALREQWHAVTGSIWTKNEWVRSKGHMAKYLAKYLMKAAASTLKRGRSYWYSLFWVFPGFVRWSKAVWAVGSDRADHLYWRVRIGGEQEAHKLLGELWGNASALGVVPWSMRLVELGFEPYSKLKAEVGL